MRGHFRDGSRETSGPPEHESGPAKEGEQPKLRMNGPEESDNRVVPEKWANKTATEVAEAESMEGRRLAKGNAEQDAVNRTLSRKGSSNGLQGVRGAAQLALLRQLPAAGAVCVSSACTDLRGGRRETGVPTAT